MYFHGPNSIHHFFFGDLEVRRAQRISSMIASAICLIEVKCEILNVPVFDKEIH